MGKKLHPSYYQEPFKKISDFFLGIYLIYHLCSNATFIFECSFQMEDPWNDLACPLDILCKHKRQ